MRLSFFRITCTLILTLPAGDADFSTRIVTLVKVNFTRWHLAAGGKEQPRSTSRRAKRRRGVWQRWFWEHAIRDATDFNAHLDYVHYNPVKHGYAPCPHLWEFSSFARHVAAGGYSRDWLCVCNGRGAEAPSFEGLTLERME
jgi:putative transposase